MPFTMPYCDISKADSVVRHFDISEHHCSGLDNFTSSHPANCTLRPSAGLLDCVRLPADLRNIGMKYCMPSAFINNQKQTQNMKYPTLNYSRLVLVMMTLSVDDNNSASNHLRFNSVFYERLSYAVTVGGSPEAVDFQLKKYDVAKRKFLGL